MKLLFDQIFEHIMIPPHLFLCSIENTKTYQQLLVKALHQCGVKFPITAEIVVPVLMDFLAEGNEVTKYLTFFFQNYGQL